MLRVWRTARDRRHFRLVWMTAKDRGAYGDILAVSGFYLALLRWLGGTSYQHWGPGAVWTYFMGPITRAAGSD